jgi:hypothetical protein
MYSTGLPGIRSGWGSLVGALRLKSLRLVNPIRQVATHQSTEMLAPSASQWSEIQPSPIPVGSRPYVPLPEANSLAHRLVRQGTILGLSQKDVA